jgi:putative membrane protein
MTAPVAPAEPVATPPTADGEWVQLHPLTPLLRGGRFTLVLLAVIGQQGLRDSSPEALLVILAVGVPLAVLVGYVSWRAMRYRVTATELQVESGVLTRRSRRVPLARVQAVDVVTPLYARVLGLAELRLEVVGGGDAEAPLSFLAEEDARRLRSQLLDLAAGRVAAADGAPAPAPQPDRVLVSVPTGPLVWSTLLGAPLILAVLVLVAFLAGLAVDLLVDLDLSVSGVILAAAVALLFPVGSLAVRRVLSEYGFTVADSPDGLRLKHGLLETRTQTIPAGRVQAIRIQEPLLWRPFGWVRVEVDVAGYGAGGEQQSATGALLPVAPADLARALVARVLGAELPAADRPAPGRARLRAPLSWPRLAVGMDARHLVSTYGVVATTTDVVPLAKVQSLRVTQGPWERRLRLASLHVDSAGRRLPGAIVLHRGDDEAQLLLADVAARARAARAAG